MSDGTFALLPYATCVRMLCLIMINPFIPKFLRWTLPSLNSDTSIVTNMDISQKSRTKC